MENSFDSLRILYYRYKETPLFAGLLITVIIMVSFMLIVRIILPQLDSWFSIQNEVNVTRARIQTLDRNIQFLQSLSEPEQDLDKTLLQQALPFEKDYPGIINAITTSAVNAGISLGDFSFSIGLLSTPSAQLNSFYQVPITLTITSNTDGSKKFAKGLSETLPLSSIVSWSGSDGGSNISVLFYYKGFPQIILNDNVPVPPLTTDKIKLLDTLKQWKRPIPSSGSSGAVASESSILDTPF